LRKTVGSFEPAVLLVAQLEGQAAPQNSFVSIRLMDSNPIGSTNLFFSFQSDSKNFKGH